MLYCVFYYVVDRCCQADEEEKSSTRKKKSKKERLDHQSSVAHKITGIDPNEPVYCLCQQVILMLHVFPVL